MYFPKYFKLRLSDHRILGSRDFDRWLTCQSAILLLLPTTPPVLGLAQSAQERPSRRPQEGLKKASSLLQACLKHPASLDQLFATPSSFKASGTSSSALLCQDLSSGLLHFLAPTQTFLIFNFLTAIPHPRACWSCTWRSQRNTSPSSDGHPAIVSCVLQLFILPTGRSTVRSRYFCPSLPSVSVASELPERCCFADSMTGYRCTDHPAVRGTCAAVHITQPRRRALSSADTGACYIGRCGGMAGASVFVPI
jgi:hypothetical protein